MARFNGSCTPAPITTLAGISGLVLLSHCVIVGFQPDDNFEAYKAVTLDGGSFKAAYKRLPMDTRLLGGWRVAPTFGGWHAERRAIVDGQEGWALITVLN